MIANGAEEASNPRRDIPLATALCLGLCTLLYAAASTVIVGEPARCTGSHIATATAAVSLVLHSRTDRAALVQMSPLAALMDDIDEGYDL